MHFFITIVFNLLRLAHVIHCNSQIKDLLEFMVDFFNNVFEMFWMKIFAQMRIHSKSDCLF
jgi:hypothetical protein